MVPKVQVLKVVLKSKFKYCLNNQNPGSFTWEQNILPDAILNIINTAEYVIFGTSGSTIARVVIAAITTLAIVEPLVGTVSYSSVFIMLSITAGSMFCSHVNDPGFWLFKQYLNLDFKTTFKTWTLGTTVSSVIAFIIILFITSFA